MFANCIFCFRTDSMQNLRHVLRASKIMIRNDRFNSTKKLTPDFTCNRYKIERGSYAKLTDTHKSFFEELLGRNRVISNSEECEGYNVDWLKTVRGKN